LLFDLLKEMLAWMKENRRPPALQQAPQPDEFLTAMEMGRILKVSKVAVYQLNRTKQIPSFSVGGTVWVRRIRFEDPGWVASTTSQGWKAGADRSRSDELGYSEFMGVMELCMWNGNLICRFANNDEIHCDCTNTFIILLEGFVIHAVRERLDFSNRGENIPNPVLPSSRRHGSISQTAMHLIGTDEKKQKAGHLHTIGLKKRFHLHFKMMDPWKNWNSNDARSALIS
jgi:hypothetical protein